MMPELAPTAVSAHPWRTIRQICVEPVAEEMMVESSGRRDQHGESSLSEPEVPGGTGTPSM
jgi:hypothetical protein